MSLEIITLKKDLETAEKIARQRFLNSEPLIEYWGIGGGPLDLDLGGFVRGKYEEAEYIKIFSEAGKELTQSYLKSLNFFNKIKNVEKVRAAKTFLRKESFEDIGLEYDFALAVRSYKL